MSENIRKENNFHIGSSDGEVLISRVGVTEMAMTPETIILDVEKILVLPKKTWVSNH